MYRTIVVGTDGSADAELAVKAAAELAEMNDGAKLHVITAYHPLTVAEIKKIMAQIPEEYHPQIHAGIAADDAINRAKAVVGSADVTAEYHELDAEPAEAILDLAEKSSADLIVVGSRGQGLAGRVLHGSVSTKVLHHAPCSVMVVKPRTTA